MLNCLGQVTSHKILSDKQQGQLSQTQFIIADLMMTYLLKYQPSLDHLSVFEGGMQGGMNQMR